MGKVVKNCPVLKYNIPYMLYITPVLGFSELDYNVLLRLLGMHLIEC
jgi:hypothetical protein